MTPHAALSFEPFDPLAIPLDRSVVVEASAGTGKTYSITLLYLRCVLETRLDPSRILVVTFTRAATAELRQRIRGGLLLAHSILSGRAAETGVKIDAKYEALLESHKAESREQSIARLARALDLLDRASIFTIDGFLQRVLSRFAFESGEAFEVDVVTDSQGVVKRVADDLFTSIYAAGSVEAFEKSVLADPSAIAALVKKVVAYPDLPLFPARVGDAEYAGAEARFERAKSVYREERARAGSDEVILAAVRSVRSVSTLPALPFLDEHARRGSAPVMKFPTKWDYMSALSLLEHAAKQKKPKTLRHLPIFDAVDELEHASRTFASARIAAEAHAVTSAGRRAFEAATRGKGALTFESVKNTVASILADQERGPRLATAVANEFDIAFVDESQDTDASQCEVFQAIFDRPGRGLVFIGDPKQAIYGFRGADVHAYVDARAKASARYTMSTNFRSRPEVVRTLDVLYSRARLPFGEADIAYPHVSPGLSELSIDSLVDPDASAAVEVLRTEAGENVVEAVADDIVRALARASLVDADNAAVPLRPKNIAVLCDKNARVAAVCRALRMRAVPTVASSDQSVFDSFEAECVELLVRAALDPRDARAVRAALFTPLFGYDVASLHALASDDAAWNRAVDSLARVGDDARARGFGFAFARFVREHGVDVRLLARPDGFRIVTNLAHIVELATRAASEKKLALEGLLAWIERARAGDLGEEMASEERSLRLEHAGDAVEVLTIHKSKGLEFDVVYVVGLGKTTSGRRETTELIRIPEHGRVIAVDVSADPRLLGIRREELRRESARLTYVALTRAKLALRIVVETQKSTSSNGLASTPLGDVLVGMSAAEESSDGDEFYEVLASRYAGYRERFGISIAVRLARRVDGAPSKFVPRTEPPSLVAPVDSTRDFVGTLRTSSFSGLTASAETMKPHDRDPDDSLRSTRELDESDPIESAPAGRELGVLIHAAFEHLDFRADDDAVRVAVDRALRAAPKFVAHRDAIVTCIRRSIDAPMRALGPRLRDIPPARTFRELEFELSIRSGSGLTPRSLAAVFAEHGVPRAGSDYARSIASLSFETLRGYLRGFIDLVFEHEGRFYVVDYKSNRLGAAARYEPESLIDAMTEHHYVLQYALYTLALHRLLRSRLRDYDYDRHIGGALYLFVRAMSKDNEGTRGVFDHRPTRAFVESLDALFDGGAP